MANNIIGFAGRARSGKSTLAQVLHNEEGYQILTIANYLKKLCCKLLGDISLAELNKLKDNNTDISNRIAIDDNFINIINQETGIGCAEIKDELEKLGVCMTTVRGMLQIIGTDIIRKYYPDWHIKQLVNEIESLPEDVNVVVDDVRFPNERKEIERLGGVVIFIMRPTMLSMVYNHPSEISLQWYQFIKTHILINYSNRYEFISNFLEMKSYNFCKLPLRQVNYLNKCSEGNSLYGVQYENINVLEYVVNFIHEENLHFDKETTYPYVSINTDKIADSWEELTHDIGLYPPYDNKAIRNPFIIENLKLYI